MDAESSSSGTNDATSYGDVGRTLVSNGSNNRLRTQDGVLASGKGDSKVLEWSSFPPEVIRNYYLRRRNHY